MDYSMVPDIMASSYWNIAGVFVVLLLLIGFLALAAYSDEGFFGAIIAISLVICGVVLWAKVTNYAEEGTIRKFCVKEEDSREPEYKEFKGTRYYNDKFKSKKCVEYKNFIAVDNEWKEIAEKK